MKASQNVHYVGMFLILLSFCSSSCQTSPQQVEIIGESKVWHRIGLMFSGPYADELADPNPFLDYRLDVKFTNDNIVYNVPGFFAADGNSAETGASEGNKWITYFTPNIPGEWRYEVSFKKGIAVAIEDNLSEAESGGFMDDLSGSFIVEPSDKTAPDNRASGRLAYVGESYLRYTQSKKYFIKVGVDAPENLFAYEDFDNTPNALDFRKNWSPHARDFEESASTFLWGGKGKNLLGAINYLANEGLNVFSFLTFNIDGDDRNVFPHLLKGTMADYENYASNKKNIDAWQTLFHKTRFDISKLDQWEHVLQYAEQKGMFLHFKTHETETDHLMDNGVFGTEGKLYYRELIARFGHHLALNWNLGEENNQPISEVIEAAEYVHQLDPYKHHLVIHTFPNQDDRYAELIGNQSPLTGASLQLSDALFLDVHDRVLKWRTKSDASGKKWALAVDEPGKANTALLPDDEDPTHDEARANALWGTLMAGGYGVEWYFGYASPNSDLSCQDFRSRDNFWKQNKIARDFFEEHIPFWKMNNANELISDSDGYCFALKDEVYVIYKKVGETIMSVDMGNSGNTFSVFWYDPRNGGQLQQGNIKSINGNGLQPIGLPPNNKTQDWVCLIKL